MALITVNEAAVRTGYCTESIRIKIRGGTLPAKKLGKRYMIEETDLGKLYTRV